MTGWAVGQIRMGSVLTYAVDLPGTDGNFISTTDSPANSIAGDIDIRYRVAMDDWDAVQYLGGKYGPAGGGQRAWSVLMASRAVWLTLSQNGTATASANSSTTVGYSDGDPGWIRVTWRQSDGRVQFFTSTDGTSWTQLGTDQTIAVASIFDSNYPIEIGSIHNGSSSGFNLAGWVYNFELRNGISGTLVHEFDALAVTVLGTRNPSSVSAGGPWTVGGSAWDWVLAA